MKFFSSFTFVVVSIFFCFLIVTAASSSVSASLTPSSWSVVLPGSRPSILETVIGGTSKQSVHIAARLDAIGNVTSGISLLTSLQSDAAVFPGACVSDAVDEPFGWNTYKNDIIRPVSTTVSGSLIRIHLYPRIGYSLSFATSETVTCAIPESYVVVNGSAAALGDGGNSSTSVVAFSFVISSAPSASMSLYSIVNASIPNFVHTVSPSAPDSQQLHESDIRRSGGFRFYLVLASGTWNVSAFMVQAAMVVQCGVNSTSAPTSAELCWSYFNLTGFNSSSNFLFDANVPNTVMFRYDVDSSFSFPSSAERMIVRVQLVDNGVGFLYGNAFSEPVAQSLMATTFVVVKDGPPTPTTTSTTTTPLTTTTTTSTTSTTTPTTPSSTTTTTSLTTTSTTTTTSTFTTSSPTNTSIFVKVSVDTYLNNNNNDSVLLSQIAQVAQINSNLLSEGQARNDNTSFIVQIYILGSQSADLAHKILLWSSSQRERAGILASYSTMPAPPTNDTNGNNNGDNNSNDAIAEKRKRILIIVLPVLFVSMVLLVIVFVVARLKGRGARKLDRAEYVQMRNGNSAFTSRADLQRSSGAFSPTIDHLGEEDDSSRSALASLKSLMTPQSNNSNNNNRGRGDSDILMTPPGVNNGGTNNKNFIPQTTKSGMLEV
jgi:hypothetical protein